MSIATFRWNEWNLDNATKHGVAMQEIEHLVQNPPRGYPRYIGNGKYLVIGRGQGGRVIEVIYFYDPDGTIYVVHAMLARKPRKR